MIYIGVAILVVLVILCIAVLYSRKRICICMNHTKNIFEYSKLSEKINRKYAKKHGYEFRIFEKEMTDRAPQWCMIPVLLELLGSGEFDYVFWIDADAIFNDFSKGLDNIVALDPSKDIYICDDSPNSGQKTTNTGTLLVKNTKWANDILNEVWSYKGQYLYEATHEQKVLGDIINSNRPDSKFHVASTKEFNSHMGENTKEDFIHHYMSRDTEYRVEKFTTWIEEHPEVFAT